VPAAAQAAEQSREQVVPRLRAITNRGAALRTGRAPTYRPTDSTRPSDHVKTSTREAIEARGASLLYLPSYSPDLNPIEIAFNKLKRLLRSAAERAARCTLVCYRQLIQHFTPA
jgi:hypothetical protein